jgi:hypothetical protein
MAVHAGDLILPRVNVVSEENRLAGTLQIAGVIDDRRLVSPTTGTASGGSLARQGECENQRRHDRS